MRGAVVARYAATCARPLSRAGSRLGSARGEASPSPVYGAALLMRLGLTAPPGFKSRSLRGMVSRAGAGRRARAGCGGSGGSVDAVPGWLADLPSLGTLGHVSGGRTATRERS